ncbi:MAG: hypothetical protein GTO22_07285 [Gemmatimonadales bacterium]|nr:hypothetical protein [Gemmatimonadales bacterium]
MAGLDVHIVDLPPMRVATTRALGNSPEDEAWEKLRAWAEPRGLLDDLQRHPVYGYNNPPPVPGRPDYGYEFWIKVDPDAEPEGDVELKDFGGGRYAVTSCRLHGDPEGSVPEVWQKLLGWVESSGHTWRHTHELEGLLNPEAPHEQILLDLYLPIEE